MKTQVMNVATPPSPTKTYKSSPVWKVDQKIYKVRLQTLKNCELAISWFPRFQYNASGGGCVGIVQAESDTSDKYHIYFDPLDVEIPDLDFFTTRILGVPFPPFCRIQIRPQKFEGWWQIQSGNIQMTLSAQFDCCIGSLYKSPPLLVDVLLTSGRANGTIHSGSGRSIQEGSGKIAGVTVVPKTGDLFLDTLLGLPCEALAFMELELFLL
eukprot:TRINITY_DN26646_c0_g2_i1.p1 TRINITY_DN26646_c0_g2~~TRINITY_DN26646_c0_g2_i1.p1  ORF type:complete len:211 (+),score=12.58 TRINITY_DN26646_c0_g2_i1:1157-1789(+)